MIRDASVEDCDELLALNEANVPEVGSIDAERLRWFLEHSPWFKVVELDGAVAGMLIGLTEEQRDYPSKNYAWFRARYERFAYIDRIALGEASRGQGWGPALYEEFQRWALARDAGQLLAEVNTQPPNPRSLRFHEIFGFVEVARQRPYGPDEEVAMLVKELHQ